MPNDARTDPQGCGTIGPSTAALTALILESRPHPEQGYRACIGILRLARHYGAARLEAACDRGSTSAPAPTLRSDRSSSMVSIGIPAGRAGRAVPNHPTSAAPAIINEEVLPC